MSESLGEFAHRHIGNSYTAREGGGLVVNSSWEGTATGYGTVFGSLIFDVEDGATGGAVQWVGQAYPPDSEFVNGNGNGTWAQVEGAHRWTISIPVIAVSKWRSSSLRRSGRSRDPYLHGPDVRGRLDPLTATPRAATTELDRLLDGRSFTCRSSGATWERSWFRQDCS